MSQPYLTISEFAGLRNVNINSLRYYEKLKILTPAWVDPQTKYRYYLPEQLGVLDAITLCIALGIPLKTLKVYVDENGNLDGQRILETGKAAMQTQIAEMQLGLELTQFNLDHMAQNQKYRDQTGLYTREIEARALLEAPFHGKWSDLMQKEKAAMELFRSAQEQGMAPVFPAGLLLRFDPEVSCSFVVQVLHPPARHERLLRIPKAVFSCMQIDLTAQTDLLQVLEEHFPMRDVQTVLVSNMLLNKLHFNSRRSEIQILVPEKTE